MAFSPHPDPAVLNALVHWKRKALVVVALIAIINLGLWCSPSLAALAPSFWSRMMANTAFGIILSVLSFYLSGERMSLNSQRASRVLAVAVFLLGGLTLFEWIYDVSFGIDSLLPSDQLQLHPGRPSAQTSVAFTVVGMELLVVRHYKGRLTILADLLAIFLIILVLLMAGAYLYGALQLLQSDPSAVMAPQTVACFAGLAFCIAGRRAANGGIDSILVEIGIAGRAVRSAIPLVIALPFIGFGVVAYLINSEIMSPPYARALMATVESFAFLATMVWMAWHIHGLESELRAQALTDNLTKIYNQRGFTLLGEQALREARRSNVYLTVYFFDLDGLKFINDTFGHETGSRMIRKMGELLRIHFRDSDVVARVGGDEFSVIIRGNCAEPALLRLDNAVAIENKSCDEPSRISYSVGKATFDPDSDETFAQLIARSDANMYENKVAKRRVKADEASKILRIRPAAR